MLPDNHPDRIHVAFDDHRLVANAGLILPSTLALRLGLPQLVDRRLDLGHAPGRANTGDKIMTLVASALPGGDCIDDADVLRAGGTAGALGCMVGHLFDLVGEHRYERRDVGFNPAHRAAIMERLSGEPLTELAGMPVPGMDEIDGRRWMPDVGWVADRFSGTEPLPRIYREVDTTPNVTRLLDAMQAHPGV